MLRSQRENQLFTGARLLSLGIDTAQYDQLFQLAQNHVLLKRDVINVDKQDDGAAYRISHSETLTIFLLIGPLIIPQNSQGLYINYKKIFSIIKISFLLQKCHLENALKLIKLIL